MFFTPLTFAKSPTALPPSSTLAQVSSEQPLITQAFLSPFEVSKGSGQASDQGQRAKVAKYKGKGKEVKPLSKAKDVAKAKNATVKAKEAEADAEAKSKEANTKAKNAYAFHSGNKENPHPQAKA